jgi:hypothetical protein
MERYDHVARRGWVMNTFNTKSAVKFTALSKKSTRKILAITASALLFSFGFVGSAAADLLGTIPDSALSKGGHKVTICHFPPGNPDNYQVITISTSALDTHIDHHDDVFADNGLCPPIIKPVQWQYINGSGSWDSTTGKPNYLTKPSCNLPDNLVSRVQQNLPEGKSNIGNFGTSAATTNVSLKSEAKVSIAYITEGAGYKNAIAYFNFNTTDLPSLEKAALGSLSTSVYGLINEKIIFPNLSNDILQYGDAVDLGTLQNNTSIGFTLISDGWLPGSGKVDDNQSDKNIFRTVRSLNTEQGTNNLDVHALLFADVQNGLLFLAFEDLNRDTTTANSQGLVSDNDFNDVVLAICVEPFNAIENISQIPDFDSLNKILVTGVSGPTSWREINTSTTFVDPIKLAGQAIMKAKNNHL